ncbi:PPPDE domain-containing protein [Plasmodiophora brassicae]
MLSPSAMVTAASAYLNDHPYYYDAGTLNPILGPLRLYRSCIAFYRRRYESANEGIWIGRRVLNMDYPAGVSLLAGADVYHWEIAFNGVMYNFVDGRNHVAHVRVHAVDDEQGRQFEFHKITGHPIVRSAGEIEQYAHTYAGRCGPFHILTNNCQRLVLAMYQFATGLPRTRSDAHVRMSMPNLLF